MQRPRVAFIFNNINLQNVSVYNEYCDYIHVKIYEDVRIYYWLI